MDRLFEMPASQMEQGSDAVDYGRISKAVELLLAAKLMLRGHHVSLPLQDDGVDLVVDYRLLVQIKSSGHRNVNGLLIVNLDGRRYSEGAKKGGSRKGLLRQDIDILACYARDTEAWWFIPIDALLGGEFRRRRRETTSGPPRAISLTEHLAPRRSQAQALSSYLNDWGAFGFSPRAVAQPNGGDDA